MHIFNVSITTVQGLKNVNLKVLEELITKVGVVYLVHNEIMTKFNTWKFSEKVQTLPKSHMHIFNVSITTVQGLKTVSLNL